MLKSAWCELTANWVWPMRDKLSNRRNTIKETVTTQVHAGKYWARVFFPISLSAQTGLGDVPSLAAALTLGSQALNSGSTASAVLCCILL